MKLRFLGISTLSVLVVVSTVVALRAAEEKARPKAKDSKESKEAKAAEAENPGIVKFATAPAPVQKTFKEENRGGKIELLGKGMNDQGVFYKALLGINGNNYEVAVGENGQLLEKILQMITLDVALEDCPAPVRKTLGEEGKGAKIEGIQKMSEAKREHYVVDVVQQKVRYQIVIMDDGVLVSKVADLENGGDTVPAPVEAKAKVKETTRRN